jgi:hypothetical protein
MAMTVREELLELVERLPESELQIARRLLYLLSQTASPAGPVRGVTPEELAAHVGDLRMPDADLADDLDRLRREQPPLADNPWTS